ncbi:MAG: type IIL restriction-modification enzyme MmeI, partial [Opitutales bacterium]
MPESRSDALDNFINRWQKAEASERANYQMFLTELCDLLEVAHPDPAGADNAFNQYVFDLAITRQKPDGSQTTVWADLYKRGAFILETKQGAHAAETKRQDAASTPLFLTFAIPDHPWVDTVDGAAVRIAMTVGTNENLVGWLNRVTNETEID